MEEKREFNDALQEAIIQALNKNSNIKQIIPERVNVFRFFFNMPITPVFSDNVIIGGHNLPLVALIGESGRVYFFALKALLKEEEIENALKRK